jgi:hypothetical protein
MKMISCLWTIGLVSSLTLVSGVRADERRFTYVYEPETLPAGALEFENWVTLRTQRTKNVGQENYNAWDLRQELEYGVTDRYTVSFYLNEQSESYRDTVTKENESSFEWKGFSIENRYNLLNPADHAIGLTLYLEGTYSGEEAEIEEKIIIGQRHGDWKWALNLEHATEWEDNLSEVEGEFGASFGLSRDLGKNWSLGLEVRNQTVAPDYKTLEGSAVYLGPTVAYHQERWWAALSVLPQIYGWNNGGSPDDNPNLDLEHNERVHIRLLAGINF